MLDVDGVSGLAVARANLKWLNCTKSRKVRTTQVKPIWGLKIKNYDCGQNFTECAVLQEKSTWAEYL